MKRKLLTAFVLLSLANGAPALAKAVPCKDAKGKFVKCPPAAAAKAPVAAGVTRDAKGKCHIATGPKKGQFTKC
jgi:hypothetical protein